MKNISIFLLSFTSLFATTYQDLGMTENDFNMLSGLTGLLTASLLVFAVFKAL